MKNLNINPYEIKSSLTNYIKNPVSEIKTLPQWNWQSILFAQIILTAATGALAGLLSKSILSILSGIILFPILTMITLGVSSVFFYYTFQIFSEKQIPFSRLFHLVFLANIPLFIFQIISNYLPPVTLVGLLFTAFLLVVGLTENFSLNKKLVIKIISALYVLFFMVWIWSRFDASEIQNSWNDPNRAPEVQLGE